MASLDTLPPELVMMICELVADWDRAKRTQHPDLPRGTQCSLYPLAALSVVSRQFQHCMERILYKVMYISDQDIPEFANVARGSNGLRFGYIKHLRLTVLLPTYTCETCEQHETLETMEQNDRIFTRGVYDLLRVLATFETSAVGLESDTDNNKDTELGLTLELSAASPSDNQHQFNIYRCDPSYPFQTKEDLDPQYWAHALHRHHKLPILNYHAREAAITLPPLSNRVVGRTSPLGFDFDELGGRPKLPKISNVKTLITRRQPLRQISPACISSLLREELSNVVCVRLEPHFCDLGFVGTGGTKREQWQTFGNDVLHILHELKGLQLKTLNTLSVFLSHTPPGAPVPESVNIDFSHTATGYKFALAYTPDDPAVKAMSQFFFRASRHLEHVSAAFVADAWHFLKTRLPKDDNDGPGSDPTESDPTEPGGPSSPSAGPGQRCWPRLKTLALTTPLL
ncbi:uncharacterized protein SPSK_04299 [Sporothrix schenckii 1099-18]|nr:uncharacterized protein SPSK_04299 [Sporothrix schenckii 1099-18]KJR83516.1 hypothetical protein SPSK_04299 [Sporothrix schenckii 1099-18]